MKGRTDGKFSNFGLEGRTDGRTDGWTDERMGGRTDRWRENRTDRIFSKWMDGWTDNFGLADHILTPNDFVWIKKTFRKRNNKRPQERNTCGEKYYKLPLTETSKLCLTIMMVERVAYY